MLWLKALSGVCSWAWLRGLLCYGPLKLIESLLLGSEALRFAIINADLLGSGWIDVVAGLHLVKAPLHI